jgi:hypothetical protein
MTRRKLGQLAVVVRRQVVTDLAELLVDDVEVVEKPLGGGVIDCSSLIARARTP